MIKQTRRVASSRSCPICGDSAPSPHHILPEAEGGTNDSKNIVWLCVPCHDVVEQIYDETGQLYSPAVIEVARQMLGLDHSSRAKPSGSTRLLPRKPAGAFASDLARLRKALAGIRRDIADALVDSTFGAKVVCRCGKVYRSSTGRFSTCLQCRRES